MRGHQSHRLHKDGFSRQLAEHCQRLPLGRVDGNHRAAFIQDIEPIPGIEGDRSGVFQLAGSIVADLLQEHAVAAECLHPAIPAVGDEDDPGAGNGEIFSVVEFPLPAPRSADGGEYVPRLIQLHNTGFFLVQRPKGTAPVNSDRHRGNIFRLDFAGHRAVDDADYPAVVCIDPVHPALAIPDDLAHRRRNGLFPAHGYPGRAIGQGFKRRAGFDHEHISDPLLAVADHHLPVLVCGQPGYAFELRAPFPFGAERVHLFSVEIIFVDGQGIPVCYIDTVVVDTESQRLPILRKMLQIYPVGTVNLDQRIICVQHIDTPDRIDPDIGRLTQLVWQAIVLCGLVFGSAVYFKSGQEYAIDAEHLYPAIAAIGHIDDALMDSYAARRIQPLALAEKSAFSGAETPLIFTLHGEHDNTIRFAVDNIDHLARNSHCFWMLEHRTTLAIPGLQG